MFPRPSTRLHHFYLLPMLLTVSLIGLALAGRSAESSDGPRQTPEPPKTASPPAAMPAVDYIHQIKPLLTERCYPCHGNGMQLGGFRIDNRAALLHGGQSGPVVVVGHSDRSLLVKLISGLVPDKVMPARGKRLSPSEIVLVRAWIDQGLRFDAEGMKTAWRPSLAPRHPKVPTAPPGSGLTNPIDRLLVPYFRAHKVAPGPVVSDRVYARRVYEDIVGMLPTPQELHAFLADKRPDKRALLARRLLAADRRYAAHWITFWNDMLRNDYTGTGYIDGGRTQITDWLYHALATNLPYDRFVAQLVDPTPESEGFVKGIVWRGVVNASQTPQMQAAQNISQVFLGINLKCASCHNSFISTWKLADSYGMAGIYADKPLEMVRCDKPTGQVAPIKFLYPALGTIDGAAPRETRLRQLAAILTCPQNGRLSRTLVNRLWARLLGRGLVEPTDEMDDPPWDPDLLDWLASDFADHGYDVRRVIAQIVTSRAYQLPAVNLKSERAEDFVFAGPVVKRLSAEQFVDAVSLLTDDWPETTPIHIENGLPVVPQGHQARILFSSGVLRSGSVNIDVDVAGAQVLCLVATDAGDGADFDWTDWAEPRLIGPKQTLKLTDMPWRSATTGYGTIQIDKSVVEKPLRLGDRFFADGIGTHANSVIAYLLPPGVSRFTAIAGPDQGAVEQPKTKTSIRLFVLAGDRSLLQTRAALVPADDLMRALGRPNRDQVVTERSSAATTLQALELTNGQTLADKLDKGAARWADRSGLTADTVVDSLYEQALGRLPTPAERPIALQIVGTPVRKAGVEDLLWALTMLPEFQLIY